MGGGERTGGIGWTGTTRSVEVSWRITWMVKRRRRCCFVDVLVVRITAVHLVMLQPGTRPLNELCTLSVLMPWTFKRDSSGPLSEFNRIILASQLQAQSSNFELLFDDELRDSVPGP